MFLCMAFEVQLENSFSGPLHLLLSLVEKDELPILDISLAKVAEEYLDYLQNNAVPALDRADFLLVATRLLYLKSKALLPVVVNEDDQQISDLSRQLQAYKICVDMHDSLLPIWQSPRHLFERPRIAIKKRPVSKEVSLEQKDLERSMQGILRRLRPFFRWQQASMERVATLEERLVQVKEMLASVKQLSFQKLLGHAPRRIDVVMSFLALLELQKDRSIAVEQTTHFGDISIKQSV